jgi:hypothetical protein
MSLIEGQWIFNSSDDGIWGSGDYYNTKEEAIKEGREYYYGDDYDMFYVGQIELANPNIGVNVSNILEDISTNVYDDVGEVAEDYLNDVKREHEDILEQRLNDVLSDWMDEFGYKPSFFKIINVDSVDLEDQN